MKTIMILIAFVSLVACFFIKNQPNAKWEMISPKGLNDYIKDPKDPRYPGYPDKVVPFFISDSVGFLCGNTQTTKHWDKNPKLLLDKAIIYKTTNRGYSWVKHDFGENEIAYSVYGEKGKIILITFDGKMMNIFESYDISDKWIKGASFDLKKIENLDWTNFDNKNFQYSFLGMAISSDSKNFYNTKSILETWAQHKFPFNPYDINPGSIYWGEHECWFTSWKGKQSFLGHLDFEKNTGGLEELNFSGEVVALSPTGKIWIAGKEDKDAVLYERESKGKYNLVKRVNYGGGGFYLSSDFLNVNNDEQIWVYSDVKFFPENHFMSSQDGGKTWTEENMPYSAIFDNPYFLYDKKQHKTLVWVNVGGGRLMMRK